MPEPYLIFTATIALAATIQANAGNDIRPLTGYQCTQKGIEYMDRTREILESDVGRSEKWAVECEGFAREHQMLQQQGNILIDQTMTLGGSIQGWNKGRIYHNGARDLFLRTKKSSDIRRTIDIRAEAHRHILDKRERDSNRNDQARVYQNPVQPVDDLMEQQREEERRIAEIQSLRDVGAPRPKGKLAVADTSCEHGEPELYFPSESSSHAQDKLNECLRSPFVAPANHYRNGLSYYPKAQLAPPQNPYPYPRLP